MLNQHLQTTLESVIDVGQVISIEPGRFAKKNKLTALNKPRAWKIWKKRINVGQEKFDKLCANLYHKEITMLKKNLTKQNVQTVLAVGPTKISKK
jgi:hypothetical protein